MTTERPFKNRNYGELLSMYSNEGYHKKFQALCNWRSMKFYRIQLSQFIFKVSSSKEKNETLTVSLCYLSFCLSVYPSDKTFFLRNKLIKLKLIPHLYIYIYRSVGLGERGYHGEWLEVKRASQMLFVSLP